MSNTANTQTANSATGSVRRVPVGQRRTDHPATVVEVDKEDQTVRRIRVTCKCGEQMTIECSYPQDSA